MTARVEHAVAFADGPGGGNPCPVVFGAEGWDDAALREAAAGFGHETAFVLTPRAGGDVRLRYFVPNHEMEMCVHATVATAVLLGGDGALPRSPARVETPLGVRGVWWEDGRALVEQFPPRFGAPVDDAATAAALAALGATPADRAGEVVAVSTARAKLLVPLRSEAVLDALRPDHEALWALCDTLEVTGAYPYTLDARDADAAARQFPVRAGYPEDPATGVAAGALGAALARAAGRDGAHRFAIAQGRAMGRPSRIEAEADVCDGRVTAVRVGGMATRAG